MSKKYQYVILFLLLAVAIWYSFTHSDLFLNLRRISALNVALLFAFVSVTYFMTGYQFNLLMKVFSIHLVFKEWLGLSVCNTMFNYYLPARGGIAVRAYYLKKKYAFTYSHYMSMIAGSQIIAFFLSDGLGLGSALLYRPVHGVWLGKFIVLFIFLLGATVIGAVVLLVLLKLGKTFKNARFNNILRLFEEGLNLFGKNKKMVGFFCFFYVLGILTVGARLFICFSAIGVEVTPLQMLIIPSLTTFSMLLPLTPANLGVREGIISGCAYWFGLPADQALLAALIDRGAAVIMTFLFGLIFMKPAEDIADKDVIGTGD
jgi:uncharacterized protein (TIRG00374 family)